MLRDVSSMQCKMSTLVFLHSLSLTVCVAFLCNEALLDFCQSFSACDHKNYVRGFSMTFTVNLRPECVSDQGPPSSPCESVSVCIYASKVCVVFYNKLFLIPSDKKRKRSAVISSKCVSATNFQCMPVIPSFFLLSSVLC